MGETFQTGDEGRGFAEEACPDGDTFRRSLAGRGCMASKGEHPVDCVTAAPAAGPPAHAVPFSLRTGFTLIELMLVIGIVSILSTIAVSSYAKYVYRAEITQVVVDMGTISRRIDLFRAEVGYFPESLEMAGAETTESCSAAATRRRATPTAISASTIAVCQVVAVAASGRCARTATSYRSTATTISTAWARTELPSRR